MELHYSTLFEANADQIGDATAIVQGAVRLSWRQFDERAARFASVLLAHGLRQGSRVGQLLHNAPELLETYHGSLKLRAVPFNMNFRYTAEEVLYLLDNSDAEALVFHNSLSAVVAEVLPRARKLAVAIAVDDGGPRVDGVQDMEDLLAANAPADRIRRAADDPIMIYTGGTTGRPKGVLAPMRPHLEEVLEATPRFMGEAPLTNPAEVAALAACFVREDRRFIGLPLPPLVHSTALLITALPALIMGGTVVLAAGRTFDPVEAWDLVERERVTSLTVVGDAFARPLLDEVRRKGARDIGSLRVIASAGAVFSSEVKSGLLAVMTEGAMILDYVSATEAAMGISIATRDKPAETARFTPNPGVLVLDDENRPVEPGSGRPGRIAVPSVTLGYLKDEDKTALTFPEINGRRYAIPGDYALVEADGSLKLLGRGSTCINTGGEKVYPDEVEEVLRSHPAVEDAVVFGLPDERFGQRIAALLSLKSGEEVHIDEVLAEARRRLAGYKLPRQVGVVASVPRNNIGKHDYPAARLLLEAQG